MQRVSNNASAAAATINEQINRQKGIDAWWCVDGGRVMGGWLRHLGYLTGYRARLGR